MRALSEQWQFQKRERRWSRRPLRQHSSVQNLFAVRHDPAPLLVSELSSSPTRSSGGLVKTYTFCVPKRDMPSLSPPPAMGNHDGIAASEVTASKSQVSMHNSDKVMSDEGDLDCLSSFASGIMDAFDQTMSSMGKSEAQNISRSLPNVFSSSLATAISASQLSSQTTSSNSDMEELSKEETGEMRFMMDEEIGMSSPVHASETTVKEERGGIVRIESGSSSNWGPSPDSVYDDVESPGHLHWRMERRSTLGSTDSGSYLEQVEVLPERQRSVSM